MRVIKPQRLSILQRAFEVRGQRLLALGLAVYVPFDAPELPLPEISMWQEIARQAGANVAIDEGLPKPRGEVLLFGKAFAPGRQPRPAFQVRVAVGPIDKTVYVVGERRWVRGAPSPPEPRAPRSSTCGRPGSRWPRAPCRCSSSRWTSRSRRSEGPRASSRCATQ